MGDGLVASECGLVDSIGGDTAIWSVFRKLVYLLVLKCHGCWVLGGPSVASGVVCGYTLANLLCLLEY